jgi:membrane protease YdiL (CAAX protease family)
VSIPAVRKAAILLALLGARAASTVLALLPPAMAKGIRAQWSNRPRVDRNEREAVFSELLRFLEKRGYRPSVFVDPLFPASIALAVAAAAGGLAWAIFSPSGMLPAMTGFLGGGGLHALVLPFFVELVNAWRQQTLSRYLFRDFRRLDLLLAAVIAPALVLLLALRSPATPPPAFRLPDLAALLAAASVVPLVEETVSRGLLFDYARRLGGLAAALAASSLFFAAGHMPKTLIDWGLLTGCGLLLGIPRSFGRPVGASFLAHAAANVALLLL